MFVSTNHATVGNEVEKGEDGNRCSLKFPPPLFQFHPLSFQLRLLSHKLLGPLHQRIIKGIRILSLEQVKVDQPGKDPDRPGFGWRREVSRREIGYRGGDHDLV